MSGSRTETTRPPRMDEVVLAPASSALVERLARLLVPLLEDALDRVERRRDLRKVNPRG